VKCKGEKDLSEFYIKKNGRPHSYCNKCKSEVKKEWDRINVQHVIEYKEKTREHRDEQNAIYRENNKEKIRINAIKNNERLKGKRRIDRMRPEYKAHRKVYEREWRNNNSERYNAYFPKYHKDNPSAKIAHTMRTAINKAIDRGTKSLHLEESLGCSIEFFLAHLESLFEEDMNWGNHGFGEDKWNVHHYPPLASYTNLNDPEQLKQAFHWSHSYPVWTLDNIAMNSWYEGKRYLYKK
jgi:hypothetical protein